MSQSLKKPVKYPEIPWKTVKVKGIKRYIPDYERHSELCRLLDEALAEQSGEEPTRQPQ